MTTYCFNPQILIFSHIHIPQLRKDTTFATTVETIAGKKKNLKHNLAIVSFNFFIAPKYYLKPYDPLVPQEVKSEIFLIFMVKWTPKSFWGKFMKGSKVKLVCITRTMMNGPTLTAKQQEFKRYWKQRSRLELKAVPLQLCSTTLTLHVCT